VETKLTYKEVDIASAQNQERNLKLIFIDHPYFIRPGI
jgi:hypothetical protein